MGDANNQLKELVNEAIHNHFHDKIESEMILKDWLYGICEQAYEYEAKAKAFDRIKAYSDKVINGEIQSLELAEGIMDVVEQYEIQRLLESGERNEC